MTTALIIGATGSVGSRVVEDLDRDSGDLRVRLATSRSEVAERWRADGRDAVVLDLDRPEHLAAALAGVDRVFLLTGYSADMLYQSKLLVDAAADAGVSHLVHLGVFSSRRDRIPHFAWHDLIETYIEASGIAWTHLHPNVITDPMLASVAQTRSLTVHWQDAPKGWICTADIGAVAAAVLREGPDKHGGVNYWLSTEVLTGPQVADILTEALGTEITCNVGGSETAEALAESIPDTAQRLYMESAVQTMREAESGHMTFQAEVYDDVQTVLGRPGTSMKAWAQRTIQLAPEVTSP